MKKIQIFVLFLTLNFTANAQIFEAEEAELTTGATVGTNALRSEGAYVLLKEGNLTLEVHLDKKSYYNIYINAASTGGKKINAFAINGASLDFTLTEQSYSDILLVSKLPLDSGKHTIEIIKSWGWINIDYFKFEEQENGISFNIDQNPVTSNPTAEAKNLYNFLLDTYRQRIISGVMTLNPMDEVQWLKEQTGKEPALLGIDLMHCGRNYNWYNENEPISDARNYYNRNGIPAFTWHWRDPSRQTEEFYTSKTSFDISKINDENSAEYKAMIADIDYISQILLQLQNDSVAILWRPLHEAAGGWFWWGAKGPQPCKKLWHIMFDRMVNYHGLKNLLWVWTREPNDEEWYPGDDFVDIVGRDIYKDGDHSSQILEFLQMNSLYSGRKMLAISECGSFPDPNNLRNDEASWSFFMPWYGDFVRKSEYNPLSLWIKTMNHQHVITLDEMPDLRKYVRLNSLKKRKSSQVKVFPSVTKNLINIVSHNAIGKIQMYDVTGKNVYSETIQTKQANINISAFKTGIYIIKIAGSEPQKIIKTE